MCTVYEVDSVRPVLNYDGDGEEARVTCTRYWFIRPASRRGSVQRDRRVGGRSTGARAQ